MQNELIYELGSNVATLMGIAYLTYLIELPIIASFFYKKVDFKYINIISLMANLFTNIVLNGIIIPILVLNSIDESNKMIIIIIEAVVILVECLIYKLAFVNYPELKNKRIIIATIVANICSSVIGQLLINVIENL